MANETTLNERHKSRMVRKKKIIDQTIEQNNIERGIILVHTGNGKGKSSSAFGMLARTLGHGFRAGVVQFIKGPQKTGEELFFQKQDNVQFYAMGEGFTWDTQDRERDIATCKKAWLKAVSMLTDPDLHLVILDELNIVLSSRYMDVADVIAALKSRPQNQHVVITGRGAPDELVDIADTVTEMKDIKHAYRAGIKAQPGIEL